GWADILSRYAIIPQQQFAYTTGKNASDITLVIDAMDLLHSRRFDGFCLVSSDSDFTRLAARIREEGVDVYGFGEKKTPESFRQACRRFIYVENLLPEEDSKAKAPPKQSLKAAEVLLKKALSEDEGDDGWVSLGVIGKRLGDMAPDFDPRNFGFRKLSDLVRGIASLEVDKGASGHLRLRLKPGKTGRKAPADKGN
ncbi:MAG: NYN domain-containing protein, partial [Zavarzinia sp.]|nr:NYN domain-containing protein [Zavarzinia sp.]